MVDVALPFAATALAWILPGMVGGLLRALVGISKNVLASKKRLEPWRVVFTLLVGGIIGGVAGALVGGDWRISLLAGYAGSDLLEALYKTRILGLFRLF